MSALQQGELHTAFKFENDSFFDQWRSQYYLVDTEYHIYMYVCFFFLSQAKICKLLDAASLSITAVVFLHCINIEAIYVTFFQFYFALMEFQFKGVITAISARVTFS